ncbi:MAG: hypothetical protein ACRD2S_09205 [Terriglobales bacterium]
MYVTGNRAIPGVWLSFEAACGLIAAVLAKPYHAPLVENILNETMAQGAT